MKMSSGSNTSGSFFFFSTKSFGERHTDWCEQTGNFTGNKKDDVPAGDNMSLSLVIKSDITARLKNSDNSCSCNSKGNKEGNNKEEKREKRKQKEE